MVSRNKQVVCNANKQKKSKTREAFTSLKHYLIYNFMQFQPISNDAEKVLIHKFNRVNCTDTGMCSPWLLKGTVPTH